MAKPINFPQANTPLGRPEGWSERDCGDIMVYRDQIKLDLERKDGFHIPTTYTRVIEAWKLNPEELEEVKKTGVVWVTLTGLVPPISVSGVSPFE